MAPAAIWQGHTPARHGPAHTDGLPTAPSLRKAAAQATPENTIIFLADRNIFEDDEWTMQGASVAVDASGAYTIPYVRDGVYWPVAVKDLDGEGAPFEAMGFYDPDGDEQPDSLVVSGEGVITGIDFALFDFTPVTARENLAVASEFASRFADDQELRLVSSVFVEPDGKNLEWSYDFYSPSKNLATTVFTNGFFVEGDTLGGADFFADLLPLPDTFLDSDVAKKTADQNGGLDFLNQHTTDPITLFMRAGNQFWKAPRDPDNVFWDVEYLAATDTAFVLLNIFIDAETGAVFIPTATETETELPVGLTLRPNYPNPFSRITTIPFALSQATHVTLRVYDVLGRAVATLVDEVRPAGPHTVAWQPNDLPNGLYFYRLQTGNASQSGTMTLTK